MLEIDGNFLFDLSVFLLLGKQFQGAKMRMEEIFTTLEQVADINKYVILF